MWVPETFYRALVSSLTFGAVGIVLMVLGFRLFDLVTPRVSFERELAEKHNMAVATVVAAVILGTSYIVAHAIT